DRLVEVALFFPHHAAYVVGTGIFRVEPDRLIEVGGGAAGIALIVPHVAAIGIGEREFRIEPDRLVIVRDSVVEIAFFLPDIAAIIVRLRIFRIDADRLVIVGERRLGVVPLAIGDRAVVIGDGEIVALGLAGLDDSRAGVDRLRGGRALVLAHRPVVG